MTATRKTGLPATMKAWSYDRYARPDRFTLGDVPVPAPATGQILVRAAAASLNAKDWRQWRANPGLVRFMFGLRRPRHPHHPGTDVAGIVAATGPDVDGIRLGQEVYAVVDRGALAEYVLVEAHQAAPKPSTLTFEEAAAVPLAALTALEAVRGAAKVGDGDRVLVNGAAGGVGTFAIQLAKALGASHVTGVCSARNLDLIRALGADQAIDYAREDFTRLPGRYDALVDAAGGHSFRSVRRVLEPRARIAIVGGGGGRLLGPVGQLIRWGFLQRFAGQSSRVVTPPVRREDLEYLADLIDQGRIRPALDTAYPFAAALDAMEYVATGHARAKVVVTMPDTPPPS